MTKSRANPKSVAAITARNRKKLWGRHAGDVVINPKAGKMPNKAFPRETISKTNNPGGEPAPMDSTLRIVTALYEVDPSKFVVAWEDLENRVAQAEFVAIDPVIPSIGVDTNGNFSGVANVLIKTSVPGFHGQKISSSLTIPALVSGSISLQNKVEVDSFKFRFGTKSGTGLAAVSHGEA